MPSKKVLIFGGSCVVALGAIIFAYIYSPTPKITAKDAASVVNVQSQSEFLKTQLTENDADNDGLKDWEESLWGTDPKNADSDSDGINDGQEVKNGTNPMVKGPNDKLTAKDLPQSLQASASTTKEVSVTDKAAQKLFNDYMMLKQSGQTIDATTQSNLIEQFLQDNKDQPILAKSYSSTDLIIAHSETQESIKAYGNTMGLILKNDSPKVSVGELGLLQQAVDNNDATYLKKIDIIVEAYQKMLKNMKSVSVPPSAATLHASLMSGISEVIYSDQGIQKFFTDSVAATVALQQYGTAASHVNNSVINYTLYFKDKNIVYASTEPGFRLSN